MSDHEYGGKSYFFNLTVLSLIYVHVADFEPPNSYKLPCDSSDGADVIPCGLRQRQSVFHYPDTRLTTWVPIRASIPWQVR